MRCLHQPLTRESLSSAENPTPDLTDRTKHDWAEETWRKNNTRLVFPHTHTHIHYIRYSLCVKRFHVWSCQFSTSNEKQHQKIYIKLMNVNRFTKASHMNSEYTYENRVRVTVVIHRGMKVGYWSWVWTLCIYDQVFSFLTRLLLSLGQIFHDVMIFVLFWSVSLVLKITSERTNHSCEHMNLSEWIIWSSEFVRELDFVIPLYVLTFGSFPSFPETVSHVSSGTSVLAQTFVLFHGSERKVNNEGRKQNNYNIQMPVFTSKLILSVSLW